MQQPELQRAKAVAVASILEIYDFTLYIFFAPIIAQLFFPHGNSWVAMLETFAIFAIGYFSRPLGAVIFGHYGDKLGRRKGLLITIVLMATTTTAIGLLPTYSAIGIAAPLLLVILRFLQGIAIGGDLPGAITFVAEYADDKKRGLLCSLVYCGVNIGLLLASAIGALLISVLSQAQLMAWGWRVAFVFGIVVGFVGFYLRRKMADTPHFIHLEKTRALAKLPLLQLFRESTPQVLRSIGLAWLFAVIIAQVFLFMPSYLHTTNHFPLSKALLLNSINVLLFSLCIPFVGYLSDKIGRKPVNLVTATLFVVFTYPLYTWLSQPNFVFEIIAMNCFAVLAAGIVGTVPSAWAEMFPTSVRYSGVGVAYNIGFAIFAGLTPVIATYLLYTLHQPQAPSYNLIVSAIMAFIAALTMQDGSCKPLHHF
jgi:MHS family proline/betaine transporter-like MFS transporter